MKSSRHSRLEKESRYGKKTRKKRRHNLPTTQRHLPGSDQPERPPLEFHGGIPQRMPGLDSQDQPADR